MRRFLLGELGPEERERVEARFAADPAYFEALCALEEDMILSHLRRETSAQPRAAFEQAFLTTPARRKRVYELQAFVDALPAQPPATSSARPQRQSVASWPVFRLAAAAGLLAAGALGAWLAVRSREPQFPTQVEQRDPPESGAPVLLLLPGLTRSELGQSNVFRIPATEAVLLEMVEPIESAAGELRASIRPVGASALVVTTAPEIVRSADGVRLAWTVPAGQLPPGDYVLTLNDGRDSVASRFFTIVP
jgi:hypothetical protein